MKKKKLEDYRTKKPKELKALIEVAEVELVKFRMEKAGKKLKDVTVIRKKREEIAIMKTIIRESELKK